MPLPDDRCCCCRRAPLGWQRGVTENLTLGSALHGTMAAFGVAGGELTATGCVPNQRGARPAVVGTAHAYLFAANTNTSAGVFEGESSLADHGVLALTLGMTLRRGAIR